MPVVPDPRAPSAPDRRAPGGQAELAALSFDELTARMRACRLCVEAPLGPPLAHEPRPIFRVSATARLAVCSQAPGTLAHAADMPFRDPSGVRLRAWMGVDEATFYDARRVMIIPMGFCFPGQDANGGDLPPRRECRLAWHDALFAKLPRLELILSIGQYALDYHLPSRRGQSLTEKVRDWRAVLADEGRRRVLPLPHPSWRNNAWLKKHPFFETELLPALRTEIARLL
jgi:uracil-DNA glycosylase